MVRERSPERVEFLASILWEVVLNNGGYGGLYTVEENIDDSVPKTEWYAVMAEMEDQSEKHRVTIDTIARGVSVITGSKLQPYVCTKAKCPDGHRYCDNGKPLLHNSKGERLWLNPNYKRDIVAASMANADESCAMDVTHYLAIAECGIYGRVVFG